MYYINKEEGLKNMLGKTFTKVISSDEGLRFIEENGNSWLFSHEQECCEDVFLEDVAGSLDDLVGSPLLMAEEVSNEEEPDVPEDIDLYDSYEWTFYKFATAKGYVAARWFGAGNTFYSISVDLFFKGSDI